MFVNYPKPGRGQEFAKNIFRETEIEFGTEVI